MQSLEHRIINTLKTIQVINASVTIDEVFDHLTRYGLKLGFETVSISPLLNPVLMNIKIDEIGRSTWPEEFLKNWIDNNYVINDPVSRRALTSRDPINWNEARKTASKTGAQILGEASEFGLKDGMTVPVHLPKLPPGGVAFSGSYCDMSPDEIAEIQLVCTHGYSRLMQLSEFSELVKAPLLTDRECDILHYVAAGKTNWEIAKIYNLSEYSVKDHMKNISVKFNAANRTHAVSLGIMSGQIII